MATRSYICRENGDGTYTCVYCHFDGYLTHNGAMLLDHYNTKERVDRLMELGFMSGLQPEIEPNPTKPHTFEEPQPGVTLFYNRDRGERREDNEAQTLSLEAIDDPESWIDYCYVYGKDGKWRYFECGKLKDGLRDLQKGLEEEYDRMGFPRPKDYYGFYTKEDIAYRREQFQSAKEKEKNKEMV